MAEIRLLELYAEAAQRAAPAKVADRALDIVRREGRWR